MSASVLPDVTQSPCIDTVVPFGDDEAILARFRVDGYVVVSSVLSEFEVNRAVDELWTSPQLLGRSKEVQRGDPSTWHAKNWPQQDGGRNFLSSTNNMADRACWELPQHHRVVHLMRLLNGGAPVFALTPGRYGVMRPTADHPEWRTDSSWLHWDQNPWREPGFERVQAFLCLSAQTPTSGGFLCVPGAHEHFAAWGEANPEGSVQVNGENISRDYGAGNPFPIPDTDPLQQKVVRILAPPGAMVLWDSRTPHQNFPNTGSEFRIVQYLDCLPLSVNDVEARREVLRKKLVIRRVLGENSDVFFPSGLSALGRELFCIPVDEDTFEGAVEPDLASAICLTIQSGEDELQGDLKESVRKMQQASKLWPDIEEWHEALFGD